MNNIELLIGLKIAEKRRAEDDAVRKRDREFGLRDDVRRLPSDTKKIALWYRQPFNGDIRKEAKQYKNSLNLFSWVAILVFFLIGIGAAGVAFYYDGNRPINILPILFLFVCVPFGLLLISIILQLIRHYFKPEFLAGNTIIRYWESMLSLFTVRQKTGNGPSFIKQFINENEDVIHTYLYMTIQKAGLAYILGAVLWFLINIVTTDLAFSWSSTLNMGPHHMHAITETLALPWRDWLRAAIVDYDTIEKTRYFRAWQEPIPEGATAYDMGVWWTFLLMSLLTYSLLPRLAAFAFHRLQLTKKADYAIRNSQEGQSLLQRMDTPFIDTTETDNINFRGWESPNELIQEPVNSQPLSCILLWSFGEYDINMDWVKSRFGIRKADVYSLGGLNSLAEDDQIISRVSSVFKDKDIDHKQHLILLVEYWESADVDFEIILKKLRAVMGNKLIRIVPVAINESDIKESNRVNWLNKIQHVGDPLIRFDHDSRILLSD